MSWHCCVSYDSTVPCLSAYTIYANKCIDFYRALESVVFRSVSIHLYFDFVVAFVRSVNIFKLC